jgi:general secretion pathway protein E
MARVVPSAGPVTHHPFIADILRRSSTLSPDVIDRAVALLDAEGKSQRLESVLVDRGLADEISVAAALAEGLGFPLRPVIDHAALPLAWLRLVAFDLGYARRRRVVPIEAGDQGVTIAVADPLDTAAIDDLRATLGSPLEVVVSPPSAVLGALSFLLARLRPPGELSGSADTAGDAEQRHEVLEADDDAQMVRWVSSLFVEALEERATDIHIQPEEHEVVVRYRIDGELRRARTALRRFLPSILARIKVMSGLDIAEKRLPQDGRIGLRVGGREIDVRVSTIPVGRAEGERVALRLLDRSARSRDLADLGLSTEQHSALQRLVNSPAGMVLVSGPTGAGKTTTLYACVSEVNRPNVNILTAEDPIEYVLPGVSQMQVHPRIGLDFASCLRAFLRQDPDVILVGEIRDPPTAEVAIQAALTGHLVLSTIHTKDAAGVAARLGEMGIQGFYVAATLEGAIAQRLVRVLCPSCKAPRRAGAADLARLGSCRPQAVALLDCAIVHEPRGCVACHGTGYRGRTGLYEILVVSQALRALLLRGADTITLRQAAIEEGMLTLREDGIRKVAEGTTSLDEIVAATQDG